MNRASPSHLARAGRWLAFEGAALGREEMGAAAARVYVKLQAQLAPLVGAAGFQALLARSAKLTQGDFSCFEGPLAESPTKLRAWLQAEEPAAAAKSAEALFGTFLTLLTTFIGERLTTQVLRGAWPSIDGTAHGVSPISPDTPKEPVQ